MCTGKYVQGNVKTYGGQKPKTKIQREVLAMAGRLPRLTDAQTRWARTRHEYVAFYWKLSGETWCQCCGHRWRQSAPELYVSINGVCVCPHCGEELKMEHIGEKAKKDAGSRYTYHEDSNVFYMITAHGSYTVVRVFLCYRYNKRVGDTDVPTKFEEHEIWQDWIRDDGREVIVTKRYNRSPYHFSWDFNSDWGIGKHNGGCSGYFVRDDVYQLHRYSAYPRMSASKVMVRNGFSSLAVHYCQDYEVEMLKGLLTDPMMEWMAKTEQFNLLRYYVKGSKLDVARWYPSFRIANKNGYKILDAGIYVDYLELLEEFGKDTRSPKYLCPVDLYHEHDKYVERKTKKMIAERAKEAAKYEPAYRQRVGKYFGVCFGNDNIMVSVICSVAEMAEEGTRMHHCVFANKYYEKKNSLILSARTKEGARLETVEVNMSSWKVMQSRGLQNNPTAYHREIIRLVQDNMHLLQKCG